MTPHNEDDEVEVEDRGFLTEASKKFRKKPHIAAVANAIGDVIEEQGGPLVPASFFGVVITTLSDGKEKTEDEIANLLSLLAFVFEKASAGILRAKFAHVCGVLLNIFAQCPESDIIIVKLISCVSLLAQAQDPNTLQQQEGLNCINFLLSLSSNEHSGISRAAHIGLLSIFKSSNAQVRKVLSVPVSNYVHKILTSQPTPSEDTLVTVLKLVKKVFRYLSANHVGKLCEDILRLPGLAIAGVTAASFQSILGLVTDVDEEDKVITLQAPQLITLVDTLIDMQPHFNDTKPLVDYAVLMAGLFNELSRMDSNVCAQKMPTLVEHLVVNFAADNNEIKQTTHDALASIVNNCITKDMITQAVASPKAPLRKVIESLESALSPMYNRSWDKVLLVIAALFEKLGANSAVMLGNILSTVGELYNTLTPQTHMPVFTVLGFAISSMGPQKFLQILPLNLETPEIQGGSNPNRAWLLPLLRANIEQTELKFFADYFIPLANQVTALSKKAETFGRLVEAKNKQILHDQIWDLFPAFCDLPTDLTQNFKGIARTLGTLLTENAQLRKVLCTGLLKLIEKNLEISKLSEEEVEGRVTPAMAKSGLKAMAQFTTNFLPIFFNVFEKLGPSDNKDTLFNLITAYIKISDPQVASNFFKKLMQKLLEASIEPKKEDEEDLDEMEDDEKDEKRKELAAAEKARKTLVDAYSSLSSAFVPSLSSGDLDFLLRVIKPFFKSNVVHTQKRAYKILRGMCSRDIFVDKNLDEIKSLVMKASNECSSAAKKQRIFVLSELQAHLSLEEVTSPSLLADIIFCSREINASARKVAIQMLIAIAHRVQSENIETGLRDYMNLVIAGLAGTTPVMISGSISALTAIITEFQDVISPIFIKDLFFTMTLLLQSKHAEILTETISFLKATFNLVDAGDMKPALKQLAEGFAYMMQHHKGKFRDHGVHVVTKMIKRYGYDSIIGLFPEDCYKVLRAINKRENKKKDKSKKEKEEASESESDESDTEFLGENLVGGNKTYDQQDEPETFIIEDDENPLDFLDKKAMKRVISAKPQEQKEKQKKKSEFKMLPDGRLLIQDSDDDEESHNMYFGKTSEKLPIDDRMMDTVDKEMFGNKSRRMTKKRMLETERKIEDAGSDEDDDVRPLNEKFKKNSKSKATTKYAGHQFKAKKAGGDVKLGKVEPFAYIPLDVRNLNKRRRHQAVNAFKPIAKASKKAV